MSESQDERKYYLPAEYAVEVYRTQEDMIGIKQEGGLGYDDSIIVVSPERVDSLIRFLRSVKDEILTDKADNAEARTIRGQPPLNS